MAKFLAGTHGVGKSTLLKQVREIRPDYYTTDGISRPVRRFVREQHTTLTLGQEQKLINDLTLFNFDNALLHKNYISTRSIIDCIAYATVLYPDLDVEFLKKHLQEKASEIEYVFYIPIEFELKDDGIRMTDKKEQKQIDKVIKDLLFSGIYINPEKVITIKGTPEERIEKLKQYL